MMTCLIPSYTAFKKKTKKKHAFFLSLGLIFCQYFTCIVGFGAFEDMTNGRVRFKCCWSYLYFLFITFIFGLKGKATLKENIIKMKDILFPNILVQVPYKSVEK